MKNKSDIKLFYRGDINQNYFEYIKKIINHNNVLGFTKKKIDKLNTVKDNEEFIKYKFFILKKWIKQNEIYKLEFLENLERIVYILNLEELLYSTEKDYLLFLKNIIFAKSRTLKQIIVDFEVFKNENIYFKYDYLFFIQNDSESIQYNNGQIFLSDKRIIFAKENFYFYLSIDKIKEIKFNNTFLQIKYNNDDIYQIFSLDFKLIYISLERIFKKINIKF